MYFNRVALIGDAQELQVYKGDVLKRDGLYYKPFTNEPLTAKVETYHENGQLEILYTVIDGKREGLFQWWHEKGQLKAEATFVNERLEGLYQLWFLSSEAVDRELLQSREITDMSYCTEDK